jgi:serine/threonine-protein kinase RsbW
MARVKERHIAYQKAEIAMILRLSLELPEDLSYIRITRILGRALLEHLQADKRDIDDIEILVGELCSNVIRHAQSHDDHYHVVLEYFSDLVKIIVEDRGSGFSFKDVPQAGTNRADFQGGERIGGYGMQLIQSLSDRLEFQRTDPHGTTVCAEKKLRYRTIGAAANASRLNHAEGHADVTTS